MPPISETLAVFAHKLRLEQVPYDVRERAKHLILDAIGCALAARGETFAMTFAEATRSLSTPLTESPGSGVMGFDQRLPLRDACLLNAMLAHGLDFDDTHVAGIVHLTVSVFPTLLGLCGQRRADGATMLAAYIAGLEAGSRIASVAKGGFHAQGFHPTGLVGVFASTLAAGRVMGLSPSALAQAQGLALSMASGSLQFIEDGAWTKRLHPGWAAQAAITATTFAAHGVPGPTLAYEGRYGLFRLHLSAAGLAGADLALATAGLPIMLHAETLRLTRVYEKLGMAFPPFREFDGREVAGHIVICPAHSSGLLSRIPSVRTAVITGWALDPSTIHRSRCTAAFPLSDHADYPSLLTFVELVQPKRVLTLHGFAREFAATLRQRGVDALALGHANQLELFAPPPT